MRKIFISLIVLTVTAFPFRLQLTAQAVKETLTNAKIIEMARLGLGEAVIVAKIRRSSILVFDE